MRAATWSKALEGMHPSYKQVPPRRWPSSTTTDVQPELRAAKRRRVAAGPAADHADVDLADEIAHHHGRSASGRSSSQELLGVLETSG